MSVTLAFLHGVGPDVAIRDGVVQLVYGHEPWVWLTLSLDGGILDRRTQPCGYYPKTNGLVSLAHDGTRFIAWGPASLVRHPPGTPVGVHATGISAGGTECYYGTTPLPNPYASYGLWECFDDGTCRTWDECYYVPKPDGDGQTHHSADGRVWVREQSTGGTIGAVDGRPFLLWPGADAKWPRVSCDGSHVAVVCWGDPGPQVRVWIGTPDELAALAPIAPPTEAQPIAPFASHFYAAAYKDPSLKAPANVIFAPEPLMAPITGPAIVGPFRKTLDFAVGWTLAIEDVEASRSAALACKAVKDLPTYAYLGGYVPEARIDGIDYPLLQAYRLPGTETAAAILAQLRADLARCAYAPVGLAVDLTDRTLPGVGGWPESDRVAFLCGIADLCREIQPAAVFAWAWDRKTPQAGLSSSPVLTEQWRLFVEAIPAPVVPPPVTPDPPEEPSMPPPYHEHDVLAYCETIRACYREAGREPDDLYPVWPSRAMYDYASGALSWAAACAKHLRECRKELGLTTAPTFP